MSDPRIPDGDAHPQHGLEGVTDPEEAVEEQREQLAENDKHLREGAEPEE